MQSCAKTIVTYVERKYTIVLYVFPYTEQILMTQELKVDISKGVSLILYTEAVKANVLVLSEFRDKVWIIINLSIEVLECICMNAFNLGITHSPDNIDSCLGVFDIGHTCVRDSAF